jgi:hypothetical protein
MFDNNNKHGKQTQNMPSWRSSKVFYESGVRDFVNLLALRLIFVAACVFSDVSLPNHAASGVEQIEVEYSSSAMKTIASAFVRWDSVHYINIATRGYSSDYQFVFFPFYPLVLRLMGTCVLKFYLLLC